MRALNNKIIKIFTLVSAATVLLSGCGGTNAQNEGKTAKYESPGDSAAVSGVVAENSKYQLIWDDALSSISLYDKSDGYTFTTLKPETEEKLDEFGLPMSQDPKMLSDILVQYVTPDSTDLMSVNSNIGAVNMGNITTESIENGLRVTYFFEDEEFSIPVNYTISEDGLSVSLNPSEIKENENKVVYVSIAPFACSCKNDSENSYLFVPSGSGALIYPTADAGKAGSFSGELYGSDPLTEVWEKSYNTQEIKLPVYGVKEGDRGVCAIISSGSQSAKIEADYNSASLGSSTVYTTFKVRGSTIINKILFGWRQVKTVQYTEGVIQDDCTVDFYLLKGENASYVGMANIFREKALKDAGTAETSAMNLVIYGGANVNKSFLGIPYKSVYATTTVEQAEKMIKELTDETGVSASVMLKGFGNTGIDIGEIGGGYKVSGQIGSLSELNDLGSYCEQNNIGIYFDFDMVRQSGIGWFASNDTTVTSDNQTVYQYIYDKATYSRIKTSRYTLVSRKSLTENIDKLISKTAKWNVGVALDTFSNIAYSDYSDLSYIVKGNIGADVGGSFAKLRESGKKVASVSANYYAAEKSDAVFETPSSSNKSNGFSVDVPFYQIVFKGKTDIGCEAVNLAYNESDALLKSVESGTGVTYALYYNYDPVLTDTLSPVFITGTYDTVKQSIVDEMKALKDYYYSVADTSVKEHILITEDVRKTVFENGTAAYVNYSDSDYTGDFGTVAAHGYLTVPAGRS